VKLIIGNIIFAGLVAAYYQYVGRDVGVFVPGVVLALACFVAGTLMGYALRAPNKKRTSTTNSNVSVSTSAFDEIE
jgi:hypothetical protein